MNNLKISTVETSETHSTDVMATATVVSPRILQLDTVLNRSRMIWERQPSNNN